MRRFQFVTAVALAAVAPVGLIACGDDDDDDGGSATTTPPAETAQLPEEFTGEFLQIRKGTPQAPKVLGSQLEAADGTPADVSFNVGEPPPPPTGSAECGGETFDQAATQDLTATGKLAIDGTGTAELSVSRIVSVTEGSPPPVCEERTGTWTGNAGELAGRSGTFTMVATHAEPPGESTLTLTEE